MMREVKSQFFERFKFKDLGHVKRFLGVWVDQTKDFVTLKLHQTPYCKEITEKVCGLV